MKDLNRKKQTHKNGFDFDMFYDIKFIYDLYINKVIKPSGNIEYRDDSL